MGIKSTVNRPTLCITLLNTFSEKELEAFSKMLISPYFNKDEQLILLLKAIKKYTLHQNIYDDTIKLRVYNFTYRTKCKLLTNSHKNGLNLKMNYLLRLAEKFLCLQKIEKDEFTKLDLLYPQLIARKQYHLFNKHFRKDEKLLKEQIVDEGYYEKMYKLHKCKAQIQFNTSYDVKEDYMQEMVDYNDLDYLTRKLTDFAAIQSLNEIHQKKYDLKSYNKIDTLIDYDRFNENQKLILLKSYYNFIKDKTEASYLKFVSNLYMANEHTSKNELRGFYKLAIEYCSHKVQAGFFHYRNDMFAHYKTMIEEKLLLQNGTITPILYTNIITLGCSIAKLNWTNQFADTYKNKIRATVKEPIYNYGLGVIAFTNGKFGVAQKHFFKVVKTNTLIDFKAKIGLLKCFYEVKETYALEFLQVIKTTANFINASNNLPNNTKQSYLNFIKLLLQLYNYRFACGKLKLTTIKQNIEAEKFLNNRAWLTKKVAELTQHQN